MKNSAEQFTEEDSLKTMSQMIEKVKDNQYENGSVPILWGVTITLCGLVEALQLFEIVSLRFNVFWITIAAFCIQLWIVKNDIKKQRVITYREESIKIIWALFLVSMGCLCLYYTFGLKAGYSYNSPLSLQLLLYFMPTLFTGIIGRFTPMIVGGLICLALFFVSLFSNNAVDAVLLAIAATVCWLAPGIILRKKFYAGIKNNNA